MPTTQRYFYDQNIGDDFIQLQLLHTSAVFNANRQKLFGASQYIKNILEIQPEATGVVLDCGGGGAKEFHRFLCCCYSLDYPELCYPGSPEFLTEEVTYLKFLEKINVSEEIWRKNDALLETKIKVVMQDVGGDGPEEPLKYTMAFDPWRTHVPLTKGVLVKYVVWWILVDTGSRCQLFSWHNELLRKLSSVTLTEIMSIYFESEQQVLDPRDCTPEVCVSIDIYQQGCEAVGMTLTRFD